jgi:hypothetical protein
MTEDIANRRVLTSEKQRKPPQRTSAPPGTGDVEVPPPGDPHIEPYQATAKPKKRLRDRFGTLGRKTRAQAPDVPGDPAPVHTPAPVEPANSIQVTVRDSGDENNEGAGPPEQLLEHSEVQPSQVQPSKVQPLRARFEPQDSGIASMRQSTSTYAEVAPPPGRVATPSFMADYTIYRERLGVPDRPPPTPPPPPPPELLDREPTPMLERMRGRAYHYGDARGHR